MSIVLPKFNDPEEEKTSPLNNWKDFIAGYVEKLDADDYEERISGLKSINQILTARYVSSDIIIYLDGILDRINKSLFDFELIHEHDESIVLISALCLNLFGEFEKYATIVANDIIGNLNNISEEECSKISLLGNLAFFSLKQAEIILSILKKLIAMSLSGNKRITARIHGSIIHSIALIIIKLPHHYISSIFFKDIEQIIMKHLHESEFESSFAIFNLLSVVHGIIKDSIFSEPDPEFEIPDPKEQLAYIVETFSALVRSSPSKIDDKSLKKELREKSKYVLALFDNETPAETHTLNLQTIEFKGPIKLYLLSIIHTFTGNHFLQQLSINQKLHALLDINIVSHHAATSFFRKNKFQIEMARDENEKERYLDIKKKRNLKEGL